MNKQKITTIIKYIGIFLGIALVAIQFFPPEKNQSNDQSYHIITKYAMPKEVSAVMTSSCYDCHSNYTNYPWYNNFQPVSGWLAHHIEEGNKELNFSKFASYSPRRQYRKFEEIIEEVKENKMPLPSYTWTHGDAVLNENQKQALIVWAETCRDTLRAHYPIDSLQRKKK